MNRQPPSGLEEKCNDHQIETLKPLALYIRWVETSQGGKPWISKLEEVHRRESVDSFVNNNEQNAAQMYRTGLLRVINCPNAMS